LGYITGKPRTIDEWSWSVETLRNVAEYALQNSQIIIAFEPINRFETFFLNIAADAVKYCQDIGTSNVAVHLDTFHMIREETSFAEAVKVCGKKYLKHIHLGENNRGIPGTGLVPWTELFTALNDIGYSEAMSIESFDPGFTEINKICAIWRTYAESGEALATEGLKNLKSILTKMTN
jgi:D-psicose/D-tagatose/L-ribulose 3-epimerase